MIAACGPDVEIAQNPGARLGAAIGGLAKIGRNKLTLVTSPPIESLGLWIEPLVAESTGKNGRGIIPIVAEPLGAPSVYGNDRLFVHIRTADSKDDKADAALHALIAAGHPVLTHVLRDTLDLGAEFFPLAGRHRPSPAFPSASTPSTDPAVQEARDHTRALLLEFQETGSLPNLETLAEYDGISLLADEPTRKALTSLARSQPGKAGVVSVLKAHFSRVRPGDYVSITQYFDEGPIRDRLLQVSRRQIRDTLRIATTTGYAPRSLHTTGQLHKGGPDTGLFLQLTADDGEDLPSPASLSASPRS